MKPELARLAILEHGLHLWDEQAMPAEEYGRRLVRVQAWLREQGLDAVALYANAEHAAPVAYLSNYCPAEVRNSALAVVTGRGIHVFSNLTARDMPALQLRVAAPMSTNPRYADIPTNEHWGELIADVPTQARVGFVGRGETLLAHETGILEALGDWSVIDVDEQFYELVRGKDATARSLMSYAARVAARAWATMSDAIRPEALENEIVAVGDHAARLDGCQDVQILVGSGADGLDSLWPGRNVELAGGTDLRILVSVKYHGYWADYGDTVSVGEPDGRYRENELRARSAFEQTLPGLRAGAGLPPAVGGSEYLWAHGIGLERVEAVDLNKGEIADRGDVLSVATLSVLAGRAHLICRTVAVDANAARVLGGAMTGAQGRLIDAHFHWLPREVEDALQQVRGASFRHTSDWWDLPNQLEHMDATGREIDVICSGGVATSHYAEIELGAARELTRRYNEEMVGAQQRYPGRVWGTCVLPVQDTTAALAELEHAIGRLGLVGVSLPARVGPDEGVDAPRLEPFFDRVEQLGVPLVLHPTDNLFAEAFAGYGGALHLTFGRVVDVSVCALRLILSGVMERHPNLKVLLSHTGGALPYQAGRLDKNSTAAGLPERPSTYLKRMYTDTVSPEIPGQAPVSGVEFAVSFFGADHVLFGDDHPCWDTTAALRGFDGLAVDDADRARIASGNARDLFGLAARS